MKEKIKIGDKFGKTTVVSVNPLLVKIDGVDEILTGFIEQRGSCFTGGKCYLCAKDDSGNYYGGGEIIENMRLYVVKYNETSFNLKTKTQHYSNDVKKYYASQESALLDFNNLKNGFETKAKIFYNKYSDRKFSFNSDSDSFEYKVSWTDFSIEPGLVETTKVEIH